VQTISQIIPPGHLSDQPLEFRPSLDHPSMPSLSSPMPSLTLDHQSGQSVNHSYWTSLRSWLQANSQKTVKSIYNDSVSSLQTNTGCKLALCCNDNAD